MMLLFELSAMAADLAMLCDSFRLCGARFLFCNSHTVAAEHSDSDSGSKLRMTGIYKTVPVGENMSHLTEASELTK